MEIEHILQPNSVAEQSVVSRMRHFADLLRLDRYCVASAFASASGVDRLINELPTSVDTKWSWLLGLDNYITEPRALYMCIDLAASELRLPKPIAKGIFHPKVYWLSSSEYEDRGCMVVGSANVTSRGLSSNAEACVVLVASSVTEVRDLQHAWADIWKVGEAASASKIEQYWKRFKRARDVRWSVNLAIEEVDEPGPTNRIPSSLAKVCWIDCGKLTGGDKELEIVASQTGFFGLTELGTRTEYRTFIHDDLATPLRLHFNRREHNGMWRLTLPISIPEVANGLRQVDTTGERARSRYAVKFTRHETDYKIQFVLTDGSQYKGLQKASAERGYRDQTKTRNYGWYF
jgi:hypothetical protein